jgi:flagellar basal body-associated protein FliL
VNLKLLFCIVMGVFVAHIAVFMMFFTIRSRQMPSPPVSPPPNFKYAEEVVVNPKTRERVVNREITVSTKLRTDLYQGRKEEPAKR